MDVKLPITVNMVMNQKKIFFILKYLNRYLEKEQALKIEVSIKKQF